VTPDPRRLAGPLLRWFDAHARDLPWRRARDPYRIWVSEVMLQQTQVETVRGYYAGFLARFPTVEALAAAAEDDVLAAWSGLGYYRRARLLHRAARQVVAEHGGALPTDPDALGALPGFGPYTVGAVLSIAHDARLPVLDGNVTRVLARVFRVAGDPARGPVKRRLWELAAAVLPRRRVGDFNQALMEVGALVCRPKRADCGGCPLARRCAAAAAGDPLDFPAPGRRAKVRAVRRVALHLTRPGGAWLMVQRPPEGLLASMWELPAADVDAGGGEEALADAARALGRRLGLRRALERRGTAEHRFSHRHWTVSVYATAVGARWTARLPEARWIGADDLAALAVPTVTRKVLRAADAAPSPEQRALFPG